MSKRDELVIDLMARYIDDNVELINPQIEEEICCHNIDGKCINRKCFECVSKYFYNKADKIIKVRALKGE